jgi:hypothetical protein
VEVFELSSDDYDRGPQGPEKEERKREKGERESQAWIKSKWWP